MEPELDHVQFATALQHPDQESKLQEFLDDHDLPGIRVSDIKSIVAMVCKGADIICPLVNKDGQ